MTTTTQDLAEKRRISRWTDAAVTRLYGDDMYEGLVFGDRDSRIVAAIREEVAALPAELADRTRYKEWNATITAIASKYKQAAVDAGALA